MERPVPLIIELVCARPEHPAKPQPPQLFPGRAANTASSFSSTSTLNLMPATPRNSPTKMPTIPTQAAAIRIPVILIYVTPS